MKTFVLDKLFDSVGDVIVATLVDPSDVWGGGGGGGESGSGTVDERARLEERRTASLEPDPVLVLVQRLGVGFGSVEVSEHDVYGGEE